MKKMAVIVVLLLTTACATHAEEVDECRELGAEGYAHHHSIASKDNVSCVFLFDD